MPTLRPRTVVARLMVVTGIAVALAAPGPTGAQEPDPAETQRQLDEVRAQRGEADLQVDALVAQDAEVTAAITTLRDQRRHPKSELARPSGVREPAEAEVDAAATRVAREQSRIDGNQLGPTHSRRTSHPRLATP